ncbi:hypothetical protein BGZ96_008314 [Linnemannia gamsii]|uniref:Uncharacterized protein n=1 Tax=Linnemannia gamsii TaxID=64522 RepID=A0ABQ7JYN5_9FUNG|nr:hypothetical protein BGZ96_008314 [Linnemannia gamsii]
MPSISNRQNELEDFEFLILLHSIDNDDESKVEAMLLYIMTLSTRFIECPRKDRSKTPAFTFTSQWCSFISLTLPSGPVSEQQRRGFKSLMYGSSSLQQGDIKELSGPCKRALEYAVDTTDPEYKTAFTAISAHTPTVLLAFIASKCEQSGYTFKTAECIRSALKQYFETTFNCQGETWSCDDLNNWTGNPVFDPTFVKYYKSLKTRDGRSGVSKQSLAASYKDMQTYEAPGGH